MQPHPFSWRLILKNQTKIQNKQTNKNKIKNNPNPLFKRSKLSEIKQY